MKKVTLAVLSLCFCMNALLANSYLDSLSREYNTAKTDTQRINVAIQILSLRMVPGTENYNPDSAIALLETNLSLAKSRNYPELLAYLLSVKSNYLLSKREYESASICIDSSIRLIEPLKLYVELGQCYFTKARIYEEMKLPQRCVEFVYKAIAAYEKSGDKGAASITLFYLARLYKDNHQYEKAEEFYLKSAQQSKDSVNAGMCYAFCASMALKRDDLNQAKKYLDKSKPILSSKFAFQPYYYYYIYGQWLKATGKKKEALDYFIMAAEQCIKGNQRYQKPATLCRIAEIYIEERNFKAAKKALDEASIVATEEKLGTDAFIVHSTLSKYYEAVNMPVKAFEEFKNAQILKDSSNQNQLSQSLTGSALEFDYNKKEIAQAEVQRKKDEAQAQKLRTQKLIAYSAGVVLVFVGLISFLLYRNNREQKKANKIIAAEKQRSENLLLNILPEEVAEELKEKGEAEAKQIDAVTVLFTDFKGFTTMSEQLTPKELVRDIHECFSAFDHIMEKYGMEKIKTIGDSYMAAGGLPTTNQTHAIDAVHAAIEIRQFIEEGKARKIANGQPYFEIRIGIHTGPVVAGIVGVKKFAYDIWGDTVNTASRMESSGEAGKINISETTYNLIKDNITCHYRGEIEAKNKGKLKMYFVA